MTVRRDSAYNRDRPWVRSLRFKGLPRAHRRRGRGLPAELLRPGDSCWRRLRERWGERYFNLDRLERLHRNVLVGGRHLALADRASTTGSTAGARPTTPGSASPQEIGRARCARRSRRRPRGPTSVDALIFVTVTGVATPSLDARLMNRLALRPRRQADADLRPRLPRRRRRPGACRGLPAAAPRRAWRCCSRSELCSLTLQRRGPVDPEPDRLRPLRRRRRGGRAHRRRRRGERAARGRDALGLLPGLRAGDGMGHLRAGLPCRPRRRACPRSCASTCAATSTPSSPSTAWRAATSARWVAHPGGPKVLEAMEEALELPPERAGGDLAVASREVGNLSSTSVLLVLRETMAHRRRRPAAGGAAGDGPGLLLASWCCCEW